MLSVLGQFINSYTRIFSEFVNLFINIGNNPGLIIDYNGLLKGVLHPPTFGGDYKEQCTSGTGPAMRPPPSPSLAGTAWGGP